MWLIQRGQGLCFCMVKTVTDVFEWPLERGKEYILQIVDELEEDEIRIKVSCNAAKGFYQYYEKIR